VGMAIGDMIKTTILNTMTLIGLPTKPCRRDSANPIEMIHGLDSSRILTHVEKSFGASRGGVPNKILLLAFNQNISLFPKFWAGCTTGPFMSVEQKQYLTLKKTAGCGSY